MRLFGGRSVPAGAGGRRYELPKARRPLDATRSDRDDVRNLALAVWIQWGPGAGLTREQRVAAVVGGLDEAGLRALIDEVSGVEGVASGYVWEHSPGAGKQARYAPRDEVDAVVLARHPWVDAENLSSIYNHACYETWHG